VLEEARKIVPDIWSNIQNGKVRKQQSISTQFFPKDCFVLCRTNAGLLSIATHFLKNNIDFSIGSKAVAGFRRNINQARRNVRTVEDALDALTEEFHFKSASYMRKHWSTNNLEATFLATKEILIKHKNFKEIDDFLKKLNLHSDRSSGRRLMTGHGCKGLESDNVFIVNKHLCYEFAGKANTKAEMKE
jgi:superfamily I DNA/RNA helicase